MFLPECAHEPSLLEIIFVLYLESLHNLCLVQCSCENARLCSLVWVFVARIHEKSGVSASIDPFKPSGISHSFQFDQSITDLG